MDKTTKIVWYVIAILLTTLVYVNARVYINTDMEIMPGIYFNWADFIFLLVTPTYLFVALLIVLNNNKRKRK